MLREKGNYVGGVATRLGGHSSFVETVNWCYWFDVLTEWNG